MLHAAAHAGYVPKQHQQGKEQGGIERPAEEYLDALRQQVFHHLLHISGKVYGRLQAAHLVEVARIAGKAVCHIVVQSPGVERSTGKAAHKHVEDIENAQGCT